MSKVTIGLKNASDLILEVGKTQVVVNGFAKNLIQVDHGHGITTGVDGAFWEAWLKENKDSALVKGGFIFALEAEKEVIAKAKDKKKNKSGTEALEQNADGVEAKED